MKERRIVPIWLSVVLLLLSIGTIVVSFIWMVKVEHSSAEIFSISLDTIAALFAISYCLYGYKKDGAVFFKVFSTGYMCSRVFALPLMMSSGVAPAVLVILNVLSCAFSVVLAVGRDIGRSMSLAMVWAIAGIKAIDLICAFMIPAFTANPLFIIVEAGAVLIALIYCIMMIGKYRDKTARGTM